MTALVVIFLLSLIFGLMLFTPLLFVSFCMLIAIGVASGQKANNKRQTKAERKAASEPATKARALNDPMLSAMRKAKKAKETKRLQLQASFADYNTRRY